MRATISGKIAEVKNNLAVVGGKIAEVKQVLSVVGGKIVSVWESIGGYFKNEPIFRGAVRFYNNDVGNGKASLNTWTISENFATATQTQSKSLDYYQSGWVFVSGNGAHLYVEEITYDPHKGKGMLYQFNTETNSYELSSDASGLPLLEELASSAVGTTVTPVNPSYSYCYDCNPFNGSFSYDGQYLAHLMKYNSKMAIFIFKNTGKSIEYVTHSDTSVTATLNIERVSYSDDLKVCAICTSTGLYYIYSALTGYTYTAIGSKGTSNSNYRRCRVSGDGKYFYYNSSQDVAYLCAINGTTITDITSTYYPMQVAQQNIMRELADTGVFIPSTNEFVWVGLSGGLYFAIVKDGKYTNFKLIYGGHYNLWGVTRDGKAIATNVTSSTDGKVILKTVTRDSAGLVSSVSGSYQLCTIGGDYTFKLIG